jgi:hypothetical protein
MGGVLVDGALELREGGLGFRIRDTVSCPVVPRAQVHQRLGVERPGVEIVGKGLDQPAHGVGVGAVGRRPILGATGVARGQRLDVGAFAWRRLGAECQRLLDQGVGLWLLLRIHRRVDVGPEDQRLPPVGHRQRWIETGRFGVGAAGFGVVEAIGEVQPLVHEQLRARIRGAHRKGVGAEVLQARRQRLTRRGLIGEAGWRVVVLVLWGGRLRLNHSRGGGECQREERSDECW